MKCMAWSRNLEWNTDLIETAELEDLIARLHSACTVAKSTTNLNDIMLTNLPKCDDVQWMKHTISRLNAKHVEDAKLCWSTQRLTRKVISD